jgi:hypothetical protein
MLKDAFNSEAYNDRFLTLLDTATLFIVTKHNFAASKSVSDFRNAYKSGT